jgi:hypothetical protein
MPEAHAMTSKLVEAVRRAAQPLTGAAASPPGCGATPTCSTWWAGRAPTTTGSAYLRTQSASTA